MAAVTSSVNISLLFCRVLAKESWFASSPPWEMCQFFYFWGRLGLVNVVRDSVMFGIYTEPLLLKSKYLVETLLFLLSGLKNGFSKMGEF